MSMVLRLAAIAVSILATPVAAETKVIANVGLVNSEAARHDPTADRLIVTNLGPRGPGNDGFVSLFSPDGTLIQLKWIEGGANGVELHDPLGVFIKGDLVYVADTATVRTFDRVTGRSVANVPVPGAVRLNDLTVDYKGTIYVTDSGNDDTPGALFRITAKGKVSTFAARNPALERPNGIAIMADGNIVHGGRGVNLVIRSPRGAIIREITLPTGRFDGIIPLADASLLVASQDGKNVYRVPLAGKPVVVASDFAIPAAIGFDAGRNRLVVPQIVAATLTLVDLP